MTTEADVPRFAGGGRRAGSLLVIGAGLMFAGGGTPFVSSLGGEVWNLRGTDQLMVIASAEAAWSWANGLILAGTVLTLAGLAAAVPWLQSLQVSAATGWMTVGVFYAGTGLWMAALVGRLSITLWAADLEDSSMSLVYEGFDRFQERALDVFMILGLSSLVIVGAALTRTALKTWGRLLLALAVLALALTLVAERIPAFVYMGTGLVGLALVTTSRSQATRNQAVRR